MLKNHFEVESKIKSNQSRQKYEEKIRKEQYRHDYKVACFSAITGALFGLIASIIYNMYF